MTTPLSSRWTPFYKFVLPVLIAGGMCYGTWRAYVRPDELRLPNGFAPEYGWLFVVLVGMVVALAIWWSVAPLKRIALDGDELVISNYLTEIRVPLSGVEAVSGRSVTDPKRYTLTFAEPTEFGRQVTFMPPMIWSFNPWAEPEEVGELRAAWAAALAASVRRR